MTIGAPGIKDAVMFSSMKKPCLAWAALGALCPMGVLAIVGRLWPANYPSYPSSGHYAPESGRFFNTPPLQAVTDRKGQRAALWAMFFHRDRSVPPTALPFRQADWTLFLAPAETAHFIWLGHSSLLARLNGQTVLIDPVFASRVSPIPGLGRHFTPLPVALQALPEIDVVLYSHNHYDHLDEQVIRHLLKRPTRFIVPLSMGALLQEMGVPPARIRKLDWWQSHTLEGVRYHAVPARHGSGRLRYGDTDRTLWAGWVLQTAGERF